MNAKGFVKFLQDNSGNTGVMADLRKGFSSATAMYSWRHISRFCSLDKDRERTIGETVGAAFATHPMFQESDAKTPNMGTVMRKIAGDDLATFESRFRRILTCDSAEEVCSLLRGVISAAKSRAVPVPVPYLSLISDLEYWGQRVKVRWASEFWGVKEPENQSDFLDTADSETDGASEDDGDYDNEKD